MTTTCLLAWAAVLLTVPFLLLWRLSQTREQRIQCLGCQGMSQRAIAQRMGISVYAVRKALA